MVEGLARQIASLSTAKSTESHDHDSYSDQANAIGVIRKPSNYNPYSNTYNPGWRDHPNFHGLKDSNRMDQQLQLHQCNQFRKFLKPLSHHSDHNQNQNHSQPRPWEDSFQNLKNLTHSILSNKTAPLMDYEMN